MESESTVTQWYQVLIIGLAMGGMLLGIAVAIVSTKRTRTEKNRGGSTSTPSYSKNEISPVDQDVSHHSPTVGAGSNVFADATWAANSDQHDGADQQIDAEILTAAEHDILLHWNSLALTAEEYLHRGGHRGICWQIMGWQPEIVLAKASSTIGVWAVAGIELLPDLSNNEELLDAPGADQIKQASLLFHYAAINLSEPMEPQFHRPDHPLPHQNTDSKTGTVDLLTEADRASDQASPLRWNSLRAEPLRWRFAGRLLMNLSPQQAVERLNYRLQAKVLRPDR
ncbi:hypothetical protein Spb1_11510 [Planctopirus ephydatiae]|uniref:Uncharacterized protein n=1 Tax=Planctopirus ephydatiae TaxID=2528019 RepID=A0A518GLE4_9PLAN|nr:hypothetical protein Spb1_11510 [Planctopirus ephydatiae]